MYLKVAINKKVSLFMDVSHIRLITSIFVFLLFFLFIIFRFVVYFATDIINDLCKFPFFN